MKKVSIITVVRNAAAELEATLANLTALDYPLVEIIVIDGASTDGTLQVIEKYSNKIAYSISEPDKGLYDAMNKGLQAATGDYVWFINAGDSVFEKDVLTKIFNNVNGRNADNKDVSDNCLKEIVSKDVNGSDGDYLNKNINDVSDSDGDGGRKNSKGTNSDNKDCDKKSGSTKVSESADIYFGETMICSTDGRQLGLRKKKLPEDLTWRSLLRGMVVCHQSFIVRREIAPLYDMQYRYVADIDWVIKCLKAAKSIENTGLILSKFAEGGISTQQRKASLRERWKVMVKHYGFFLTACAHFIFAIEIIFRTKYRDIK